MNLPNKLTVLRVLTVPVIVALLSLDHTVARIGALALFILACITDWLDGYLARKQEIVTDLGKFLDPVADKLLVLCTMIMLCSLGLMPAWLCVLVLFRELMVDGLRLAAVQKGIVIAAGKLGKIKTTVQMILIIVILLGWELTSRLWLDQALIITVAVMTLWSGTDYFIKNRAVLLEQEPGNG